MKVLLGVIVPTLLLAGPAFAQTNCTTNYVGTMAYTNCYTQGNQGTQPPGGIYSPNYATSGIFDPNSAVKGAQAAQELDRIRNRNMANYALSHGQPEQAIKYLYAAGDITDAIALQNYLVKSQERNAAPPPQRDSQAEDGQPRTIDGVVYTPRQ